MSMNDMISSNDLDDQSLIKVETEISNDDDDMSGFSEGPPRVVLLDQQSTNTINSRYLRLDELEKNSSQKVVELEEGSLEVS